MQFLKKLYGRKDDVNHKNVAAGLVSALLGIIGAPVIILQAAANGGFSTSQTVLWMLSVYVFGGIFSILLPLYYRMPIVGAHSITGVAFLATVTAQFPYHQLIGSYIISGLFILIIGYLGAFAKLMEYVPKEIIAAMLAGMIMKYMVNFVVSIHQLPLIGGVSLLAFLILTRWKTRIPPMAAAIILSFMVLALTQPLHVGAIQSAFAFPHIQLPEFSLVSMVSVSLPLALLILSNDAAVGIGSIEQQDYRLPVNRIITFSGLFSIVAALFGGQSANVAGMMSAICSDGEAGPKNKRYMGAVISGIVILLFGIFSWKLVPFIQALPKDFVSILVGFSLIGVFANSLSTSFSKSSVKLGPAFAMIIAISNITIFHISAPVWSLAAGTFIARFVENHQPAKAENTADHRDTADPLEEGMEI